MRPRQHGFTYLGVLFLLAFMATSLLVVSVLQSLASRREREAELLFVGDAYRDAIRRYHEANAKKADPWPKELSWLIQDPNVLEKRRYLRRLYRDPVANSEEWGLVRSPKGGITGVYSLSAAKPIKRANFSGADAGFAGASRYADWRFDAGEAAGPAPAADAAPAAEAAASASEPPRRSGPPSTCQYAQTVDRTTCAALRLQRGESVYAACAASAQRRAAFCAANPEARILPPLDMR
jgi:type II secretory pathway pseudopilin PulG